MTTAAELDALIEDGEQATIAGAAVEVLGSTLRKLNAVA